MTTRRRAGSGRTTPKGTKNTADKAVRKSRAPGSGPGIASKRAQPAKFDKTSTWVSRPDTHNRGNR